MLSSLCRCLFKPVTAFSILMRALTGTVLVGRLPLAAGVRKPPADSVTGVFFVSRLGNSRPRLAIHGAQFLYLCFFF